MSVERILLGVDGSEGSARAVAWVVELAAPLAAQVVAVHVYEPLAHLGEAETLDFEAMEAAAERRMREEWLAPFTAAGVDVEASILHGMPAEVLLDVAEEKGTDLVVVGARGLGRIRGLALGSTSSKLIQSAPCPVVVIPPVNRRR